MEQRVSFLTVAGDVAVAAGFYVERLGWVPLLHVPGEVLMLQVAPGLVLAVHEAAAFATDVGSAGTPSGFTLAQNLPDEAGVQAAVDAMVTAGARVLQPARRADWGGWFAHVRDPLGVVWELAHNPSWSVADDGTVRLG